MRIKVQKEQQKSTYAYQNDTKSDISSNIKYQVAEITIITNSQIVLFFLFVLKTPNFLIPLAMNFEEMLTKERKIFLFQMFSENVGFHRDKLSQSALSAKLLQWNFGPM